MPENWQAQTYYTNLLDAILNIAEAKEYNIILKKYKHADFVIELIIRQSCIKQKKNSQMFKK